MTELTRYTIAIVFSSVAVLFVLENLFPLRPRRYPLLGRLVTNVTVSVLTYAVGNFLVRKTANVSIAWAEGHSFGLLRLFPLPPWLDPIVGFLLLDLTFYYWHRLTHAVPFLWRFHQVHHFDPDMDVSTGFRFHFGEVALSTVFRAGQALLIGVSLPVYALYELVFQVAVYFHHSNLKLPRGVDGLLSLVLVTPLFHGVHHSQTRTETDSNFSAVVSLWDKLHGTFRKNPAPRIGLTEWPNPSFRETLLIPFRAARSARRDH